MLLHGYDFMSLTLSETKKAKKGGDDGIRIASSVNFTPEKAISLLNRVFFEQHIDDIKIYQKMFVRYNRTIMCNYNYCQSHVFGHF